MDHASDIFIEHHGIKGQKWGVRRFQEPNGSARTTAGKIRYDEMPEGQKKATDKIQNKTAAAKKVAVTLGVIGGLTLAGVTAYTASKYWQERGVKKVGQEIEKLTSKQIMENMYNNSISIKDLMKTGMPDKDIEESLHISVSDLSKHGDSVVKDIFDKRVELSIKRDEIIAKLNKNAPKGIFYYPQNGKLKKTFDKRYYKNYVKKEASGSLKNLENQAKTLLKGEDSILKQAQRYRKLRG